MYLINQLCRWAFIPAFSLGLVVSGIANAAVLEEIIVTAQKREQNLQDVGISVTAFTGEQLDNLGATNTTDITQQAPGLQLFTYTPSLIVFNIRGVSQNNFIDTLEAPVAVNVDNAYVASLNGIGQQMFDMDRVEVLRGPQGTLFGRNATGGVIQYFTNAPDEEEANGYIKAGAAEYDNFFVEGAVGGALAPNLRGRFAGRWEQADGYTESVTPGVRDTNGKDGFALRGALQMDVTDDLLVDVKVYYSEDNDAPTGGYVAYASKADRETGYSATPEASPITGDVHKHANGIEGSLDREVTSVTGQVTWDLNEHLQVVSVTNYMDIYKNYYEDAGGGYIPNFPYNPVADTEQITQELRLSGDYDRFRWQLGGYYMDLEITGMDFVSGEFVSFLPEGRLDADWNLDSENWSVFGQVEVDLSEQVTLIGGVRYSMDDKQYSLVNSAAGGGAWLGPVTSTSRRERYFSIRPGFRRNLPRSITTTGPHGRNWTGGPTTTCWFMPRSTGASRAATSRLFSALLKIYSTRRKSCIPTKQASSAPSRSRQCVLMPPVSITITRTTRHSA